MDEPTEPPDADAAPWRDEERAALRQRREIAGVEADAPTVGLAISGGGVRSATFGLGLLRGLAGAGVLPRLDYLSTVSGGGFVGAMFGRLVTQIGIADAQTLLARAESPALDWLRRYGRYLMPAGARDLGIAIVTYLRAMIAIHGESLLTGLVFAVLVMTPHLVQQASDRFEPAHWQAWQTLWWPLALVVWLAVAPGLMAAYWVARDTPDPNVRRPRPPLRDLVFLGVFALALAVATWIACHNLTRMPLQTGQGSSLIAVAGLLVGWSCLVGLAWTPLRLALADEPHALAVARRRNALTKGLRRITLGAALLAVLGLLDVVSWWVLEGLQAGEVSVWGGVGVGGVVMLTLRAFAQPLQQFVSRADSGTLHDWGPRLLHVAGVVGLLVLLCAWLVAAQWAVFSPEPLVALRDFSPGVRAAGLLLVGLLWLLLTASNDQMANASSLHSFYRGRLTRAYLAIGNPLRGLTHADATGLPPQAQQRDVTKVLASDDCDMREYRPERAGGPLHLVNACLNQTRDDASELYNADRKGTLVTISARGIEIGTHLTMPMPPRTDGLDLGAEIGTLGRWVAVSGAAAAPGAGSYTSPGWALLLFFLGVRLGYWMRAPRAPAGGWPRGVELMWRYLVKPAMLMSEASATFFGRARPWWYLSDGGHFDNSGVYALLKRRVDFIVLADDGADPEYDFADLENLVRKARIDFGAEIEFYTREEGARLFATPTDDVTILSPEDMADNHSSRGVMLARVRYPADALGVRDESTLLVVKPNLHDALDLDLLGYAERHPAFPHESTGDQSFDEAQWESYQRLGEDFGAALQLPWLTQLPGWTARRVHPLQVSARLHTQAPAVAAPPAEPLWRRSARATAIGTTIGLGASGTVLFSVWQLGESLKQSRDADRTEARRLFSEVSKGVEDLDRPCPRLAAHVGPQLLTLRDLAEGERLPQLEREGVALLIERVQGECHAVPASAGTAAPPAANCPRPRTLASLCVQLDKPVSSSPLSYWNPAQDANITLLSLWHRALGEAPPARVALPPPVPSPNTAAPAAEPAATPASGPLPSAAPPPAAVPGMAIVPGADAQLGLCAVDGTPLRLYVQIYDEPSRAAAESIARALQAAGGAALQLAPVENVSRSSELRQQRRPVPWPQPTLLVHHPDDLPCARRLAATLQNLMPGFGTQDDSVWIRETSRSFRSRRGVMDLWLPSTQSTARGGW
jgi:hypothetical protein